MTSKKVTRDHPRSREVKSVFNRNFDDKSRGGSISGGWAGHVCLRVESQASACPWLYQRLSAACFCPFCYCAHRTCALTVRFAALSPGQLVVVYFISLCIFFLFLCCRTHSNMNSNGFFLLFFLFLLFIYFFIFFFFINILHIF